MAALVATTIAEAHEFAMRNVLFYVTTDPFNVITRVNSWLPVFNVFDLTVPAQKDAYYWLVPTLWIRNELISNNNLASVAIGEHLYQIVEKSIGVWISSVNGIGGTAGQFTAVKDAFNVAWT